MSVFQGNKTEVERKIYTEESYTVINYKPDIRVYSWPVLYREEHQTSFTVRSRPLYLAMKT